ncbi:MAG TPA: asparagine synthase-related protein [Candidatus Binataceae bacterium]|nr:asparagine synthase-related protein [Candidatus Binataceae bacterium]
MSGIFGIVDFGGESVDGTMLRELTEQMAFRGPDRRQIRHEGPVGFGHALLANTFESEHDHQPLSLQNDVWIVADARIDDQSTLIDALRSREAIVLDGACDAELILRAYHVWGVDCVEHLMGDFAFAIWDAPHRRLMLARDHFGVTPMYYARLKDRIVFGNTLEVVRKYPGLRDDLNDEAVGDYLLFSYSIDPENTFFSQVRSVPPASRIVWNDGVQSPPQRYWSLREADSYHRVQSAAEYGLEFRTVLTASVRDRLHAPRAAISLSGGLDSGAVAAIAASLQRDGSSRTELHSYSSGHDWMVPETERYYASLTAGAAGIKSTYISIEQSVFNAKSRWRPVPEPRLNGGRRSSYDEISRQMAEAGERVLLTGVGGDALLGPSTVDWSKFFHGESLNPSALALITYAREQRWLPVNRILQTMRARHDSSPTSNDFSWLQPDFVRRANLRDRVARLSSLRSDWKSPRHRLAYDPFWTALLSQGDAEFTGIAAKSYHPMFDLRVLEFVMSVSPLPWFVDKLLMREAMRDLLPEAVRKRHKTSPTRAAARVLQGHTAYRSGEDLAKLGRLSMYIDEAKLLRNLAAMRDGKHRETPRINVSKEIERPLSLGFWLKSIFS